MSPRRRLQWIACLALCACRKPAPEEIVFTGLREAPVGPRPAAPADGDPANRPPTTGMPSGMPAASASNPPNPATPPLQEPPGAGAASELCAPASVEAQPFSKRALIGAAVDCAVQHYCDFEARLGPLTQAAEAHAQSPTEPARSALQAAFAAAMASWQRAEAFRFGPAARSSDPGGSDLRDVIYAWPLRGECKVDEQIVSQAYAAPAFHSRDFQASPVTGRTLTALEYLAFARSSGNACSAFSPINASGSWSALGAAELESRRAAYALEVARDVALRSDDLIGAYESGGARALFTSPGSGESPFSNEQAALNAISNALFYVDLEVKDLKLGRPLGLTPDCPNATCPADVESPHARLSNDHLRQNLIGFSRLFIGCGEGNQGLGFDDWLVDVGAGDLAARMSGALAEARRQVDALPAPIDQLLTSSPEGVADVHAAIKALTDLLKTEFVTALNLELPISSEGDND